MTTLASQDETLGLWVGEIEGEMIGPTEGLLDGCGVAADVVVVVVVLTMGEALGDAVGLDNGEAVGVKVGHDEKSAETISASQVSPNTTDESTLPSMPSISCTMEPERRHRQNDSASTAGVHILFRMTTLSTSYTDDNSTCHH